MSEVDPRELEARLDAITGKHPTATEAAWLSHTAAAFADQSDQVWPDLPVELRQTFVRWLTDQDVSQADVDLFPFLIRAAKDTDEEVRSCSIEALVIHMSSRAFPVLLDLLAHSPDPEVRASVAMGIDVLCERAAAGELSPAQATVLRAALLTAYRTGGHTVRRRALESVGYFTADPEVEAAIADAYTTKDRDLTISAIFAMGHNQAPRWFPILYEELRNPNPDMRNFAARAIGKYADQRAVERLIPLVGDEDRQVQAAAISALASIGGAVATVILEQVAASDDFFLSQSARFGLERLRAK